MNQSIKNLVKYRDLFLELVKKDIKLKYRSSYIGVLWSMLNPLIMMIVLTIIFSTVFQRRIENFPVYVLTGRFVYTFFSESTNFALDSIKANAQLIRKVYVPKYFFPLSRVCSSFITSTVTIIPLVIVMAVTGMDFSAYNLFALFPLIILFVISIGLGLILSTINVFFRDIKHFYSVILTMLMYATPIFYPADIIPSEYLVFLDFNPMFAVLRMFRDCLMYGSSPMVNDVFISVLHASIYLALGLYVFYKKQDKFIFHL